MLSRKAAFSPKGLATAITTAAVLARTAVAPSFAYAGAPHGKGVVIATNNATDFSARRRLAPGGAAAAAAFAGILGTGIAIAAAQKGRPVTTTIMAMAARSMSRPRRGRTTTATTRPTGPTITALTCLT